MKSITDNIYLMNSSSEFSNLDEYIKEQEFTNVYIITDSNTNVNCLPLLKPYLNHESHIIRTGLSEQNKNLDQVRHIWDELFKQMADRNSLILNLGGGVVSDVGGFVASTYKRGIKYINIPTSLLAMVDAAIGGKTGINYYEAKNQIGTYYPPKKIYILPDFLNTLPEEEFYSGLAEMFKHGLIFDQNYFQQLKTFKTHQIHDLIKRSVEIKFTIVNNDEHEEGLRKILNFGHTIGHAIEAFINRETDLRITHGHAVALGMLAEAYISMHETGLSKQELNEIKETLSSYYDFSLAKNLEYRNLLPYLKLDKKNISGDILFVLLKNIGSAVYNKKIPGALLRESLNYIKTISK